MFNDQHYTSYFAEVALPNLSFITDHSVDLDIRAIWVHLKARKPEMALAEGRSINLEEIESLETRAGILAGLAAAQWMRSETNAAHRLAQRSLNLHANQWLACRVQLEIFLLRKEYENAYKTLSNHLSEVKSVTPAWDQPISAKERHENLTAWAIRAQKWDDATQHMRILYPQGVRCMKASARQDWFRIALSRGVLNDAADAAEIMIQNLSGDNIDVLLQTLLKRGGTDQALKLYKKAFKKMPKNEIFRRRLVGLYVQTGKLEKARKLAEKGPLVA